MTIDGGDNSDNSLFYDDDNTDGAPRDDDHDDDDSQSGSGSGSHEDDGSSGSGSSGSFEDGSSSGSDEDGSGSSGSGSYESSTDAADDTTLDSEMISGDSDHNNKTKVVAKGAPFSSNIDTILLRTTEESESDSNNLINGDSFNMSDKPIFEGDNNFSFETENYAADEKQPPEHDPEAPLAPPSSSTATRRSSHVQTVVQQWESPHARAVDHGNKTSTQPRDLPDELPHVKGIVEDIHLTAEQIKAQEAAHAAMMEQIKHDSLAQREQLIQRKQAEERRKVLQQQQQEREAQRKERDKRLEQLQLQEASDHKAVGQQRKEHRKSMQRDKRLEQMEKQQAIVDKNSSHERAADEKKSWTQSISQSFRNLFGGGGGKDKAGNKEEDTVPKSDPLQMGNEQKDHSSEQEEEDLFGDIDRQLSLHEGQSQDQEQPPPQQQRQLQQQGEDGLALVPYSGDKQENDEEAQYDDNDHDLEQQEPFLDDQKGDQDETNNEEKFEDDYDDNDQTRQDDTTQRDQSEVEPFLDEEEALGERQDLNDTNHPTDGDMDQAQKEQPNKSIPPAVYIVALLLGEAVGVTVGWFLWVK